MLYLSSNITKIRLYVIFNKAFKYPILKEEGSETLSGQCTHPNLLKISYIKSSERNASLHPLFPKDLKEKRGQKSAKIS